MYIVGISQGKVFIDSADCFGYNIDWRMIDRRVVKPDSLVIESSERKNCEVNAGKLCSLFKAIIVNLKYLFLTCDSFCLFVVSTVNFARYLTGVSSRMLI